ncbi:MAG: hypothetical protein CENE_03058 [Candidatus Celerinatantimonas neptuna]|nr:MAG: hypothetical protein CENE_03058 [Candidatus Celerinatantimonas neptuna]
MKIYQFDLILSGLRQATPEDLAVLERELKIQGCEHPNPRQDKYGVRVTVAVNADTFTQAIFQSTQYISAIKGYHLSVRSVEFN